MDHNSFIFKSIHEHLGNDNSVGFRLKTKGRGGFIYFLEDDFVVPIAIEMPGVNNYDLLIFGETEHLKVKYNIKSDETIPIDMKNLVRLQKLLIDWLESKEIKHDIKIGY